MNKDEKTSITGRTICTRSLAASTSASIEPGLRRSNRGTAKKLLTPASRKSERLTPSPSASRKSKRPTPSPSASRKSERLTPSPSSQRSNKGKNVLAQDANRSVKSGRISDKSPESAQRKGKRKASEEESTDKIKKREPVMSARSYQALFRGKPKQSEAIVHASSNDEELVVVGCSRRVPAANDGSNSESKRLPVGETSLEKGTDVPLELIKDTETVVLDASPIVQTGVDSVIGSPCETSVGETSLEKGTDVPLKLIKDTETMVLDASPIVETGDDSVIGSPSETSVGGTRLDKGADVPLKFITDTETTVLDASPIVETGDDSVIGSPSEISVGETSLEKGTDVPLKLIKETETTVLDASPNVETGDDSVIDSPSKTSERQKLLVSKNTLETNIDLPLKRKRDTAGIVLDACATVANGDDCSMTSVGETSLEKVNDVPLKLIEDFETMVLDASLIVDAGDDSVIGSPFETSERQKPLVSKTSVKSNMDLPLKRKRDTARIVLDACATVANGDDCVMSYDAVIPSPPGCKNSNQSETSSTCGKQQKVNGDLESVSSCIAKPIQESGHAPQDTKEPGPATSRNFGEKQNNMLQDKSHDPKLHLSMYPEFWIPVQLSDVQLEQYCLTLFCKYLSLSSLPKNEIVGALEETLTSVRKACDHPYVMDASLKLLLTKNLEVHEILDVEVKASGKFHLLEAMLNQIKKNGLKAVVFYQETQSKGGLLLGNMLEDFVSQKFGQISYEHGICSSKKNAINNFNKESQCFVLLLEKRACNQSIKLLRAEAFILFGSSLNPQHDIKHIGKIKIESNSEKTKIFRLYSTCTIEEKALILAKQNKPVENLNRPLTHALLMWGASYLFDKLDHFHGSEIVDSGVPFEQSIMDGVISELSSILSSNGGEENEGKLCLLLEAKHAHGNYHTGSTLLGEKHVKLSDEDSPNIFWKKLLEGKNPMWKYHSDTLQRNRKRVQYFQGSEESVRISNGGNTKKRKKAPSDVTDPRVTDSTVENDNRKISGKDHMALQSASGANGTVNGDDAIGLYSTVSGIPEDMLAGKDWRQIPCESQRSLHAVLKLDMAKLGKVLNFSEDWTSVAQKFLEYVIDNYHICQKPATALQAFQMALSWIAASLVKHKLNREESLVRAKYELAFSCSREEVDYIYAMLYCMKSLFLESTQGLQVDFVAINSKQSMVSMKEVNESLPEECMTEKRDMQYSSATKDINKTISDIKKKCKKKEQKLVQMHEEEKVELVNRFAHKKRKLETKKKLEAAILRITCSRISTQSLGDDLKRLDRDYERESDEITREKDECLKSLEQMHEAAKKKLAEDQACWISRIEKWARVELKKCVPIKIGNNKHFSGICSPNEWSLPKPQPFVVETRGSAESDQDDQDICHMPSSSAEKQPDPASNIQGQNIEAASEPQPTGSETVETGGCVALDQGDQVICPLPSSPAANQPDLAAVIEDQNIERSAEPHIAGGPDGEIGDTAVSDQDACSLPSALVGAQSDLAANFECQNTTTVVQLHTAGSDAVETGGYAPSDKDANLPDAAVNTEGHNNTTVAEPHRTGSDASPLPFSPPDAIVNSEGLNNTTMAEPHTIGSNASEMEIAEPGPQVEPTFANKLVHEGAVEPSAAVTAPVPSLLNNSTAQSTAQPVPHTPFPVFNDPFLHELEKLRRESEQTKKAYEETKSILKAELERKMAEVQAEFQRKLNEAEAEHNARAMENTKIKNRVIMNKLLANAFVCKCNDKNVSKPSAVRGRIQELALRAAQVSSLRNNTAPAPAPPPTPLQPQASFPSSVPQPRQPLISNTTPSLSAGLRTTPVVNARLRSPTPQVSAPSNYTAPARAQTPLQPQASSLVPSPSCLPLHSTPSPMPQPRQPLISNTAPSPSTALPTNPVVSARIRTPAPHLNAFRRSSSIPSATATLTSSPLPQTSAYSAVIVQNQQQQQQNSVSGLQGNNDVVWLSDNE